MKEKGMIQFFGGGDTQHIGEIQNFGHGEASLPPVPPLGGNPDPPIRNILRSVLGLLAEMILKRV